jgi:DNA-binding response OmpR family regulator
MTVLSWRGHRRSRIHRFSTLSGFTAAVPSVLVIDDEPRIAEFVSRALTANGLSVESATDGAAGLSLARERHFDLVVLDLMMPGVSGLGVLRSLMRTQPHQRVVVLSALSDVASKVRCLELGASDYLAKPFALAELVARVWVRLRDANARDEDGLIRAGGLTLDSHRRTADRGEGPIALTAREFLVLKHLLAHAGEICSRADLLSEVWGYSFDPGTNVVDVCIGRLRTKLGHDVIETVRHAGYQVPHRPALA